MRLLCWPLIQSAAYHIIVGGVKCRWTDWPRLMLHPKPIQKPAIHGQLMELQMHMTAQHTQLVSSSGRAHSTLIYFPVPQSLFHLAVSDGAQPSFLRKRKTNWKVCYSTRFPEPDRMTPVPIWGMKSRKIA